MIQTRKSAMRLLWAIGILAIMVAFLWLIADRAPAWAGPLLQPPENPEITGTVYLQGRPVPPHPSWAVALTVGLDCPISNAPGLYTYTVASDQYGLFNFTHSVTDTSICTMTVKNAHTLRNILTNVSLDPGPNLVNMGTLLEGDANNDNRVSVVDFSLLATAYDTITGDPAFYPGADFNENGRIEIADFSLLATNYDRSGDIPVSIVSLGVGASPAVRVGFSPTQIVLGPGAVRPVEVRVDAQGTRWQGIHVRMAFDPRFIEIVDAAGKPAAEIDVTSALPIVLHNGVDHERGTVDFAAGWLNSLAPEGEFALATISIRAKAIGPISTSLGLMGGDYLSGAGSAVSFAGTYLSMEAVPLHVRIVPALQSGLPFGPTRRPPWSQE